MRRKSAIDQSKQLEGVERARRMSPVERLAACVNLARETAELERAGKRHREGDSRKNRR